MADTDGPAPPVFPASTLKVIPQLLLGGSITPAQDLSKFLKTSPNVLIGTPGRLLELLSSPHVHCPQSSFEVLVMDEADRLLDLGFKDDLQRILSRLPKQRRTGLFSASVSEAVDQLIRVGLRNPVRINVKVKAMNGTSTADKRTPASLQMAYLVTPPTHKLPAIQKLLATLNPVPQKTIIYLSTCYSVDYYQHILPLLLPGQTIIPLHGKHPDKVRRKNFARYIDTIAPSILLTTDVAARGLDIPAVDLVIQLDPPSDPKTFIHRCGRAGRAGRKGLAVTFLTPGREEDYIEFLRVRQTPIAPLTQPPITVTDADAAATTSQIRAIALGDRAIHDKAQRGFVSWVQAYSKHTASSIFRVGDLDWQSLGHAWGLLKMPRMPELKKWDGDATLGVSLDWSTYAYKDKAREAARKQEGIERAERLANGNDTNGEDGKKRKRKESRDAWSLKKEAQVTREVRREKKMKRREGERVGKLSAEERVEEERLRGMIEEVRKKVVLQEMEKEEEFGGFSD
jgi:ATP-dependent RNA helicase DDX55/SPB4